MKQSQRSMTLSGMVLLFEAVNWRLPADDISDEE